MARLPWWLTVLNVVAVLMSLAALATSARMWVDKEAEAMDAVGLPRVISGSEAEAVAEIRMPAGTTLLTAIRQSTGRGLEYRTWLKFRIPRDELARFLSDSALPAPVPGLRAVTDKVLPDSGTWHPDTARDVSGIEDYLENWDSGSLMFDLDLYFAHGV